MSDIPKKSLGQHWLYDVSSLEAMVKAAEITSSDTVLEIGPGLGTLTQLLVKHAKQVIAVEFDPELAAELPQRVIADNLQVHHSDILKFDLSTLPKDYKVAANVPYYITSKITRLLLESPNPPLVSALLVQKEVAERMAAAPGDMSILAVAVQYYTEVELSDVVPARLFTPPPKVDSQIISLRRRTASLFADMSATEYFRVVRAGFSEKRKTLRNSLSGGLRLDKSVVEQLLHAAEIDPGTRAEQLDLDDWYRIAQVVAASR